MNSVISEPCVTCGGTRRYVRSGDCIRCKERRNRRYRKSLKEKIDAGKDVKEKARGNVDYLGFEVIRLSQQANIEFLKLLMRERDGA